MDFKSQFIGQYDRPHWRRNVKALITDGALADIYVGSVL
jgi:hypothetical protein